MALTGTGFLDIKIDPATDDIVYLDGDVVLIDGIEEYAQAIRIALRIFFAEWFLDRTAGWLKLSGGMPFGKVDGQKGLNEIRAKAQSVIQKVPPASNPAASVTALAVLARKLSISYTATFDKTAFSRTVEVSPP